MSSASRTFVISVLFTLHMSRGDPSWIFSRNPVIFGENFKLKCTLPNSSTVRTHKQEKTDVFNIKLLNGKPLKDTDDVTMDDRKSTLTINAYNQMGENIQYDCHHGTQTYRHTLNLTVENFRYHSKSNDASNNNANLFSIKFSDVLEIPKCTAVYENVNRTDELQTKSEQTGSLYNATIEMPYDNTSPKCTQSLEVSCNIGQITIVQNVYTTSNECSPKIGKQTHQGTKEKGQMFGIFGMVIFSIVTVLYVGGIIICICMTRRR